MPPVPTAGVNSRIDHPILRTHEVRKTRVGACSTTDLDARLRERGVNTLLSAGSRPAAWCCRPSAMPPAGTTGSGCRRTCAPTRTR
ncbi:hypothetical protein [Saccharopolyspora sp. NPDC049357]|uniref:hypothetical protein n=1 Tax=Saccharopolyspora sp. NPDC049357 TaxID=3154507 RepID=UPI003446A253